MRFVRHAINLLFLMALLSGGVAVAQQSGDEEALLTHVSAPWNGDLDGMFKRGFVRVLTTYNPLYFTYNGIEQRGLLVETAQALEQHLNKHYGKKGQRLQVLLMAVSARRAVRASRGWTGVYRGD